MDFGKFPGKDEVAKMLLEALRQDKKDVVINADIQAEIDQASFKAAEKQMDQLTKKRTVDVDTSKAEQKIKNLMEPLREIEQEIKSLSTSSANFNVAHNTIKRYEQLRQAIAEATKSIGQNNQALAEAHKLIRSIEGVIKSLDITVEKAAKKKRSRKTKSAADDIAAQTEAMKSQADASNGASDAMMDYAGAAADATEKLVEQIELQREHTAELQKATRAQRELNKEESKGLKLKPRRDKSGARLSGAYATEDGLFEVDHDADGWKVHRKTAAGLYELVKVYKTKKELVHDSALIAEQEAHAQKKAEDVTTDAQKKIEQEILALSNAYDELSKRAGRSAQFAEQYTAVFADVRAGALSAEDAIAKLNQSIDEMVGKQVSKITVPKTKYYEIDEEAARRSKENRSFDDYEKGSATAAYRAAVDALEQIVKEKKEKFPDKLEQLDELFDRYAKNLAKFINRDNQIGAQYPSVMISGAGNYNIRKHDRQMASWGKNYQYYDDSVLAIENKIRNFGGSGDVVIRGDDEGAQELFSSELLSAMNAVGQNISAMRPAISSAAASGNELADSAERAANAAERQAASEKELLGASDGVADAKERQSDAAHPGDDENKEEKLRIIQKSVNDALTQLRSAKNNVNRMIDLSAVQSAEDLNTQIGNIVTKSLGADLSVGGVVVADDIARIQLYNKELGITTQQVWRLQASTEDATQARLEFVKSDPLHVDFKRAQQYADAQEKALNDSEKSLLGYQKRLDNLTRSYQHGSKTLKGTNSLLLPDATTLQDSADQTLDGLADHIQSRINSIRQRLAKGDGLTKGEQNLFIQDLNALENEIKTMQADTYKAGNMSATEVNELRKSLTAMLDTLASRARKNNVFDAISESYQRLHDNLNNPNVPGYLNDQNISDAVQRIRTLSKETSKEIQIAGEAKKEQQDLQTLLNLQQRLYEAKKKVIELGVDGQLKTSEGMAASRKVEELKAQYDLSVKMLANEQQRATVAERQARLDEELNKFRSEQQRAQFEQNVKNEEKEQTASVREQYTEILNLVNQINTANERMIKFQSMDGGSGVLGGQIVAEQEKKLVAIEKLNAAMENLNTTGVLGSEKYNLPEDVKSIGTDYSQIAEFINDAGVQASLTTAEIEKLVGALTKAGDIDLSMLDATLNSIKDRAKQAAYENRYFADKTRASVDSQGSTSINIEDIKKLGSEGNTAKEKLEGLAQAIAQNSDGAVALSKNFTMGSDGIARLDFSILDTNTGLIKDFTAALGTATGQMGVFETTVDRSLKNVQNAQKQMQSVQDLIGRLSANGVNVDPKTAVEPVRKLLTLHKELSAVVTSGGKGDQGIISDTMKRAKIATAEVEKLYKAMLQMEGAIENGPMAALGTGDPTGDVYGQLAAKAREFAQTQPNATLELGRFDEKTNTLNASMINANGAVEEFQFKMDSLSGQMGYQQTGITRLTTSWDKFKASIAQVGKRLLVAFVGYNIFYKAISEVRKGISYVKEIDLALTELKKVTDETEASYDKFLKTAASTAGQIGSTVSDFTEATANFARLGYSMSESADMAKTAIIYRNVADGLDTVEEATQSIISTMKAFGIESSDTMGIIDRFNEVGNNFSITSAGIGEALQRSASALQSAGNTIDESIALVTAANSVVNLCHVIIVI